MYTYMHIYVYTCSCTYTISQWPWETLEKLQFILDMTRSDVFSNDHTCGSSTCDDNEDPPEKFMVEKEIRPDSRCIPE